MDLWITLGGHEDSRLRLLNDAAEDRLQLNEGSGTFRPYRFDKLIEFTGCHSFWHSCVDNVEEQESPVHTSMHEMSDDMLP